MWSTRSAAASRGIPAVVTNNGRAEVPRSTGTACVAVRNAVLANADHRDAEPSARVRTQAGPAAGAKVGVTVDHQEAQTAQPVQDRAHRRELTQIELTPCDHAHVYPYARLDQRQQPAADCTDEAISADLARREGLLDMR